MPPGTTPPFIITLQRVERADPAAGAVGRGAVRAAALRPRRQLHPRAARDRAGRVDPVCPTAASSAQIMVDLDPAALQAKGLSPRDVVNAISRAEPDPARPAPRRSATASTTSDSTAAPTTVEELNDLPIKTVNGTTIYIRDVAHVRDGYAAADQHRPRRRAARGAADRSSRAARASTLDIVDAHQGAAPAIAADAAAGARRSRCSPISRVFVRASIDGRRPRGGHRRVPDGADDPALPRQLAQHAHHRGLDPALDPDVDHRAQRARRDDQHHDARRPGARGRHPRRRRDGRRSRTSTATSSRARRSSRRSSTAREQIAVPAFVSTLCICIVFVPMFFLTGVARYLFVPLAEAVVFAMLASYVLSRTLVPTMVKYLLQAHEADAHAGATPRQPVRRASSAAFERGFERLRDGYRGAARARALAAGAAVRRRLPGCSCVVSFALLPLARPGLLPGGRRGQFKLHVRAPTGTRIEETARLVRPDRGDDPRRRSRRARSTTIIDNIGLPYSGINLSLQRTRRRSAPRDADILVALDRGPPPDRGLRARAARRSSPREFPGVHVLLPAAGHRQPDPQLRPARADRRPDRRPQPARRTARFAADAAAEAARESRASSTCASTQVANQPTLQHRRRPHACAAQVGLTQRDVANNLLDLAQRQRPDRADLLARTAERRQLPRRRRRRRSTAIDSLEDARATSRSSAARRRAPQLLDEPRGDPPRTRARRSSPTTTSQPVVDIYGNVQGTRPRRAWRATIERDRRPSRAQDLPRGSQHRRARPGREHDGVVPRAARRPRVRDRARLPADRRQLPVVARSVRHHHRRCPARSPASSGCCSSPTRRSACRR